MDPYGDVGSDRDETRGGSASHLRCYTNKERRGAPNLRIPEVPISDKQFLHFVRLLGKLTEQRCGPGADFATRSAAAFGCSGGPQWGPPPGPQERSMGLAPGG